MEEKLKTIPKSTINKTRKFPSESGLAYKIYGKSENIKDYTEREISEMIHGIYKDTKNLLVDGDYFLNMTNVVSAECILETVTYYKKPTLKEYKTNLHNSISNIRTFYIKDYFLITEEDFKGTKEHRITKYLYKIGFLNQGRNEFRGLYSIANMYGTLQFGIYPKDLFHPIKRYINGLFFDDDYKISDFTVTTDILIHTGS